MNPLPTTTPSAAALASGAEPALARRRVIKLGAAGICGLFTAGVLAACGGDDEAAPSGSSSTTPSSSPSASGEVVATLAEVPVGSTVVVTGGSEPIVIHRSSETTVAGFSAKCPHQFATVAVVDGVLDCPLHHSKFDLKSGAKISGVASSGLPAKALTISGDNIVLA